MPGVSERDIEGWAERYSHHPQLERLLGEAETDTGIILLTRGDSRPEVLRRLLPHSCYDPEQPDPTRAKPTA